MNRAVFLGMDSYLEWKKNLETEDLAIDFRKWDDLSDDAIIEYDLIVIHLTPAQIDLVHFIKQKFEYQPVVIVVFLAEEEIDVAPSFLDAGADIAEILPSNHEHLLSIVEYGLDMLEFTGVKRDSMSNALIETVEEVFMTMLQMPVNLLEIRNEELKMPERDLAVMMHVKGKMDGFIMLLLSYDFGAKIISKILSVEPELLEKADIKEGIFEIINMIAGGTKSRINDFDQTYTLTPPKALEEHNKNEYIDKNGTVLSFESDSQDTFSVFYYFE